MYSVRFRFYASKPLFFADQTGAQSFLIRFRDLMIQDGWSEEKFASSAPEVQLLVLTKPGFQDVGAVCGPVSKDEVREHLNYPHERMIELLLQSSLG